MNKTEWEALAYRAAMVRHKMWCIASEKGTGERVGPCGDEWSGRIVVSCQGPKMGDIELGRQIALEFWGKPDA